MPTLTFEKISKFDRVAEPVSVSIPFARGRMPAGKTFQITGGGSPLAVQVCPLAHWDDGSVKWLLAHFQPDLPGNRAHTLDFQPGDAAMAAGPQVRVAKENGGFRVDTGPLSFFVPDLGYWPVTDVRLNGHDLFGQRPLQGFALAVDTGGQYADETLTSQAGRVELEIEEEGPLRAVILVRGVHGGAGGPKIALNGRITAYAGKPYIEVEHQFLHIDPGADPAKPYDIRSLLLRFRPEDTSGARFALGQGYYRTAISHGDGENQPESLVMALNTETILFQSFEHVIDSFYGDFWVDWRGPRGGLALSVYQAHQNFPKTLSVSREGTDCWLYPSDAPPAPMYQGMGKTHRLLLHFHDGSLSTEEISTRSLQFQLPDRPALERSWYRENNPWVETFFPEHVPGKLITYFTQLHDSRPSGLGMFHFGDAADSGYTNQGRGKGQSVWVNNEYDRPHACALYYALTGQRRVLDSSLAAARHWLDVDLCHYSADPLLNGGLKIHTAYHVTGGVTPSHQWTEGLLDYYFLTGRREGLDAAVSVAENVLRHLARPELNTPGEASVREGGWALRALVGMYLGTGEQRWKDEARRLVDMFMSWYDQFGALLAPYTSHSMPRVPFMISLTANSFARYLLIEDDQRVKRLIVETIDDMLEHCIGPDGIVYYKELPSLRRNAPTPHLIEALTHAFRITGNDRYLKIAARQFAAIPFNAVGRESGEKFADPSGAVILGKGGARVFDDRYTSLLLFAAEAAPRGLLEWFEYPYYQVERPE